MPVKGFGPFFMRSVENASVFSSARVQRFTQYGSSPHFVSLSAARKGSAALPLGYTGASKACLLYTHLDHE